VTPKIIQEYETLLHKTDNSSEITILGQRVGAKMLCVVLDTLAGPIGMEVYIPSSHCHFLSLQRKFRDAEICGATSLNTTDLAKKWGIKPRRVQQIRTEHRAKMRSQLHGKRNS